MKITLFQNLFSNKTKRSLKYRAWVKGLYAEGMTRLYLRLNFYSILHKRFKCPFGEIDLIAQRGKTLVFIEVKMRKTHSEALESISFHQRARILKAATFFLARKRTKYEIRFDVITVNRYYLVKHYKNVQLRKEF